VVYIPLCLLIQGQFADTSVWSVCFSFFLKGLLALRSLLLTLMLPHHLISTSEITILFQNRNAYISVVVITVAVKTGPHLCAIDCFADVEVSLLAHKRCKMSDITEMHLIAGAVQKATLRVAYVHLFCCTHFVTCNWLWE